MCKKGCKLVSKHYVKILQEIELIVIDTCNGHRRKYNLAPLMFNEDCEVEECSKDCPILSSYAST